jgi:hypothetical protein
MPTMNDLEQQRIKAGAATSTAGEMAAGTNNIESILKQKLTEAYKANADIVKPLDTATANYYSAPSVAREKYQDIFNPFTREKLVSQYTGAEAIPMLSYSNLYGQRQGSIADTINAGVGAYKAQADTATNQASLAQNQYDQMWKEYQFQEQQALEQQKLSAKDTKDPLTAFLELQGKFKGFDPNSTMVTAGQNADTVLANIKHIQEANANDLSVASKIASGIGAGGLPGITSLLYKAQATPQQVELANDLVNARNVLRLKFTGAAFGEGERPDYQFLSGQDPALVFGNPENVRTRMNNLKPMFEKMSKSGVNPYQNIMDKLNESYMGTGSSNNPIVVQDLKTGKIGTLDSEAEFDPTKYKKL